MKAEESFGIVVEDSGFDSLRTDLVDFAFGAASVVPSGLAGGGVRYMNLSGIGRIEKSAKVARYAEILTYIANQMKNDSY